MGETMNHVFGRIATMVFTSAFQRSKTVAAPAVTASVPWFSLIQSFVPIISVTASG